MISLSGIQITNQLKIL